MPHAGLEPEQGGPSRWYENTSIALPRHATGIVMVAAAPWTANYYLLDDLQLQVLAINSEGEIVYKYGGWGTERQSLDFPVCLVAAENSVFVLDQGQHRILRLDAMLNPIGATPLQDDWLPLAFGRDVQRRFWVIYENRQGIHLYDDAGNIVDVIADRTDGSAAILHPTLIAVSPHKIAVWDAIDETLFVFLLSGQFAGKRPLPEDRAPKAMVWQDQQLLFTTGDKLFTMSSLRSAILPVAGNVNLIDLATRSPHIIGLDPSGVLRVFRPHP